MSKFSNWIEDRVTNVSEGLLWLFVIVVLMGSLFGAVIVPTLQGLEWLEHGNLPSRDLYWLYALYECGESVCRQESIIVTDWVGLNHIINWAMGLHVAVYAIVVGWLSYGASMAWAELIGDRKARKAGFRAPPPPLDDD
ncbi:hypothetical protein [Marimonas arenosa]|uniref:Uncharacterized protein n=1 Tax=Marimonas arenosa TaxID=1795305 RepID=A0AAE3WGP9_9RHOB|nr:hypothetical protein [Marimonas arenosa]MDQ2091375.1 hypothetical protein [Marimonas arenosa]